MNTLLHQTGLGLRSQHYQTILNTLPKVPWFEVLTDNYMGQGGQPHQYLSKIRQHYPITLHGVGLSLGSTAPLSQSYLARLKELIHIYEPTLISEHLCFSRSRRHNSHDLLPLPYTEESLNHFSERIQQVQDYLGRQILIENLSSYLTYKHSTLTEWEFVDALAQKADCYILLDINNIYVSAYNHNFDAQTYLNTMPVERVKEIHLAGYEHGEGCLVDSHSTPVHAPVWALYEQAMRKFFNVPTLIEWDNDIPEFETLMLEKSRADAIQQKAILAHQR